MSLQDYLTEFKEIASEWFRKSFSLKDRYDFFSEFFKVENLQKAEWPDFQEMGEHIHAFNSMAIAKKNALGNMNHPIGHYRNSFIYLVNGKGPIEERIDNFVYNKKYKIKYFGESVISELLGYIFADKYVLYNERDKFALKFLNINPDFSKGDRFTQKFLKFNNSISFLIDDYKRIVGKNLDVPINLEVDQFFSYLYETYSGGTKKQIKYWQIAPADQARLWDEFRDQGIAAVGYENLDLDLSGKTENELQELYQKYYPRETKRQVAINFRMLWNFINLEPGDKIVTNQGKKLFLAVGEVKSKYRFRPDRPEYKHTVDVDYYKVSKEGISVPENFKGKLGKTIIPLKQKELETIEAFFPDVERDVQYWTYSPGPDASSWEIYFNEGIMAIGWDELGDLTNYKSKNQIQEELKKQYSYDNNPTNSALACYEFVHTLKQGDIVYAKKGTKEIVGVGVVASDYKFDDSRIEFKHTRKIDWRKKGSWFVEGGTFATKTLTNVTSFPNFIERVNNLIEGIKKTTNYWWLNANPKIWNFYDFEIGETQVYTSKNKKGNKRRVYKYFEEAKPGDIVLGYISSPTKEAVGLCEITKGLHGSSEGEGIEFKKIEQFDEPVSFHELQANPELKNCEPLINNQGSLFKLTENEFEIIRTIIDEKNPPAPKGPDPYSIEDALQTVFVPKDKFENIISLLNHKKNIIIQGPPGVGKTFIAKHIAWAIMEKKDESKIQMVQFHQSYAYEDFVQGFRPAEDGNFYLKPGIFYKFCKKAERDKDNKYFFIIDEINRGNLSKIFGELMMLIESDKRGKFEIPLTYSKTDETFSVPHNIYLIGTMNTADRSLAMVDYALRRRFCFVDLIPAYKTEKFNSFLETAGVNKDLIDRINRSLTVINKVIENDTKNLGPGFTIGHSYFCNNIKGNITDNSWFERIVDFEIAPLLREYWFDRLEEAEAHIERLKE